MNKDKEIKKIKKYIDGLDREKLIEILNTSEKIGKHIGAVKKNHEIDDYIRSKLIKNIQ